MLGLQSKMRLKLFYPFQLLLQTIFKPLYRSAIFTLFYLIEVIADAQHSL